VKRSGWVFLGVTALAAAGLLAAFLGPRPPEEYPLAELVPQDARFYAGFVDYRRFEELVSKIPGAWKEEDKQKFERAKPHLAGAVAFYVDTKGEWVGLARLTRAAALLGDVEGDAAVFAQTPAALERFRGRVGTIRDLPAFQRLKSRFFLSLDGVPGDFEALGFELECSPSWVARGRAVYRPDRYRAYLERHVPSPRRAGAGEGLAMSGTFPAVWDAILDALEPEPRDRVDRECQVLKRDLLAGREVRDFLGTLGPRWGAAAVPTPQGFPALVAWVELPDAAARQTMEDLLTRAGRDWERLARGRGQVPPVEVEKKEGHWRLKFPWASAFRLGDAFTPAYAFTGNRLVFSTCAATLAAPKVGEGDAHAALAVEVAPSLGLVRSMSSFLADGTFRPEADGMALARYYREFNPIALAALARKIPDPVERAKALEMRRAELAAEALAEIAKGQKYKDELARRERTVALWTERLAGIVRIAGSGRFTGAGLEFELKAGP